MCEKCKVAGGETYTFCYGKRKGDKVEWYGEAKAELCDNCVANHKRSSLTKCLLSLILFIVSSAYWFRIAYLDGHGYIKMSTSYFLMVTIVVIFLFIITFIFFEFYGSAAFGRKRKVGSNLARALRRSELTDQGFNEFGYELPKEMAYNVAWSAEPKRTGVVQPKKQKSEHLVDNGDGTVSDFSRGLCGRNRTMELSAITRRPSPIATGFSWADILAGGSPR